MATELEKLAYCGLGWPHRHALGWDKDCTECVGRLDIVIRARALGHEEAAKKLESIKQVRLPEIFRNLNREHDAEGWADLNSTERQLFATGAAAIRALSKEG